MVSFRFSLLLGGGTIDFGSVWTTFAGRAVVVWSSHIISKLGIPAGGLHCQPRLSTSQLTPSKVGKRCPNALWCQNQVLLSALNKRGSPGPLMEGCQSWVKKSAQQRAKSGRKLRPMLAASQKTLIIFFHFYYYTTFLLSFFRLHVFILYLLTCYFAFLNSLLLLP